MLSQIDFLKRKIALTEQKIALFQEELMFYKKELSSLEGLEQPSLIDQKPVIEIPVSGGKSFPVFSHDINEWAKAYPAVDIHQKLQQMRQWCLANIKRQKTFRGCRKFITGWLAREQDKPQFKMGAKKTVDQRPPIWEG